MVRYKRYRRYGRRRSTNTIKMKFQSFMDISTSSSSMQVITISAGGKEILKRLAPQFGAYKYYKIGNIAVKLVPASTLPVDPTGLSYEAGEQTVDPRDQLTPGMMRITNGEDVFEDVSGLTDEVQHKIYNSMLLDPRWFKWMLQSGVKRHATPRYWQIGQLHQDKWPGAINNYPLIDFDDSGVGQDTIEGTRVIGRTSGTSGGAEAVVDHIMYGSTSSAHGLFQVGQKGVLGWLPTDGMMMALNSDNHHITKAGITSPPEVEVMKIILPKAYKTVYYYRMFITETVYFREPIVNMGITDASVYAYRPIDVFHGMPTYEPLMPQSPQNLNGFVDDVDTGGNYGDD